jgi:prepilin-type processing-associated H-X9-DG protein
MNAYINNTNDPSAWWGPDWVYGIDRLPDHTKTVLVADNGIYGQNDCVVPWASYAATITSRHKNKANLLFVDGHVTLYENYPLPYGTMWAQSFIVDDTIWIPHQYH